MSDHSSIRIPTRLRPITQNFNFDLPKALTSIVYLESHISKNAHTAKTLGIKREGHATMIRADGFFVTISYLVIEAEQIWLIDSTGAAVSAHLIDIDQRSGFAILKTTKRICATPIDFSGPENLESGESAIFAGSGGYEMAMMVEITGREEFPGYWEYLLDQAIFTAPAHPFWGGGGLIGMDGKLKGIGSLYIQAGSPYQAGQEGNMLVPTNLLNTVLSDILEYGRIILPPRPWLGIFTSEADGKLIIAGLWSHGPAAQAGLEQGDLILEVNNCPIEGIANFYRAVWSLGDAGVKVSLLIFREYKLLSIIIKSANRSDYYKKPMLH